MARIIGRSASWPVVAGVVAMLGAGAFLIAKETASPSRMTPPRQVATTDGHLKSYLAARREITRILARYETIRPGRSTSADLFDVSRKVQRELVGALQKQGLTIAEYNAIGEAVQHDKRLRRRVEGYRPKVR